MSLRAVCSTPVCDRELWMLARHDCDTLLVSVHSNPQYTWKRPSEASSVPSGASL